MSTSVIGHTTDIRRIPMPGIQLTSDVYTTNAGASATPPADKAGGLRRNASGEELNADRPARTGSSGHVGGCANDFLTFKSAFGGYRPMFVEGT
jgi:hypothetical protein